MKGDNLLSVTAVESIKDNRLDFNQGRLMFNFKENIIR